jgi:hypothetical protein
MKHTLRLNLLVDNRRFKAVDQRSAETFLTIANDWLGQVFLILTSRRGGRFINKISEKPGCTNLQVLVRRRKFSSNLEWSHRPEQESLFDF